MSNPSTPPRRIDPSMASELLEGLCSQCNLPMREAWSHAQAAELFTALEYQATPGTIAEFVRKGYIAPDDPAALSVLDMFGLLGALERRRRWKAAPSRHDLKKSAARLHVEEGRAIGQDPIPTLGQHSVEDLLIQLTEADSRPLRECVYEALHLKLAGFEE